MQKSKTDILTLPNLVEMDTLSCSKNIIESKWLNCT